MLTEVPSLHCSEIAKVAASCFHAHVQGLLLSDCLREGDIAEGGQFESHFKDYQNYLVYQSEAENFGPGSLQAECERQSEESEADSWMHGGKEIERKHSVLCFLLFLCNLVRSPHPCSFRLFIYCFHPVQSRC